MSRLGVFWRSSLHPSALSPTFAFPAIAVPVILIVFLVFPVACGPESTGAKAELAPPEESSTAQDQKAPGPVELLGLAPEVSAVATGGWWTDDDGEGIYRVVLVDQGFDHVVSKVWVQWIEVSPIGGTQTVRETADILDLNGTPACKLEIRRLLPTSSGIEIELAGQNSYSNQPESFRLYVTQPGTWRLESFP